MTEHQSLHKKNLDAKHEVPRASHHGEQFTDEIDLPSKQLTVLDPHKVSPSQILYLQRTIGNRATLQLLRNRAAPQISRTNQEAVQRDIGLEFEVPAWHVQHPDGKKLVKGTEIVIEQDGVNLTADDDGERSDIEWVTTALESKDEILYVMDNAADLAEAMVARKDTSPLPAQAFSSYGLTHADAEFIPGNKMQAHMQATIGVPLGKIPALYEAMSKALGPQSTFANATRRRAAAAGLITMQNPHGKVVDEKGNRENIAVSVSAPPIPVDQMSAALKGFLMLVIDYLRAGYAPNSTTHNEFPKGVLGLMAKTSFTRMLELVQNEAELTAADEQALGLVLKDEWINWLVEAAIPEATSENVGEQRQKRVLNQEFGITTSADKNKNETPYHVDVTREDWLHNMPQEDMLRLDNSAPLITEKGTNKTMPLSDKLEGFAALKNKTDKLVQDVADQMAQVIVHNVEESGEKEEDTVGESGENIPQQPLLEVIEPKEDKEKGKEKDIAPVQQASPNGKNDPKTNAPVFEMRQLEIEGGEPSTWAANALKAWDIYEEVIGNEIYRAGNRQELEGVSEGYATNTRPPKSLAAQDDVPQLAPQQITTTPNSATNAPFVPAQTGIKAKARRAWSAIKSLF